MLVFGAALLAAPAVVAEPVPRPTDGRFLYVATPGIRNYLEYGGHGVLVYAIDRGHQLVRRIPSSGVDEEGRPLNVKGICASAATGRLYVSTIKTLICFDLATDRLLWERGYEGGCDRMSISPDGQIIYLPSFEKEHWHVINALDGRVLAKIVPNSRAHNTIISPKGAQAYLEGLASPLLTVADLRTHSITRTIGPFGAPIRPFTIDGRLAYPSTGEVIDVRTREIVTTLKDEAGAPVQSEKLLEIDFKDGRPVRAGNQFALGGM